jgi:primary-amine oxidase
VVSLSRGKVESNLRLGPYVHSSADGDEILRVEKIALEDERVKAEIAKLQLPEGTVVISDPWIYGKLAMKVSCSCSFSDEYRIRWYRRRALH